MRISAHVGNNTSGPLTMPDRLEKLATADLWMRDGLRICGAPGALFGLEVDMTQSVGIIGKFSESSIRVTPNQMVFRAAALALSRHPQLHKIKAGASTLFPGSVDLGISVASDSFVAPILVLREADTKDLPTISREVRLLAEKAKDDDRKLRRQLQRWGWLVPFGWARRAILSLLFRNASFRRNGVGTFQVSCLTGVDVVCPLQFNAAGVLGVGGMRDRVAAVNGVPVVLPMLTLTCCIDHEVWDGRSASIFLSAVKSILESGELATEVRAEARLPVAVEDAVVPG